MSTRITNPYAAISRICNGVPFADLLPTLVIGEGKEVSVWATAVRGAEMCCYSLLAKSKPLASTTVHRELQKLESHLDYLQDKQFDEYLAESDSTLSELLS